MYTAANAVWLVSAFPQGPFKKVCDRAKTGRLIRHIAHAVTGVRYGQQFFFCRTAAAVIYPSHGAGNKAVILAVDKQNRYAAALHSLCGISLLRKAPTQR